MLEASALEAVLDLLVSFWAPECLSKEDVAERLLASEPFASNPKLSKTLLIEKGYLS